MGMVNAQKLPVDFSQTSKTFKKFGRFNEKPVRARCDIRAGMNLIDPLAFTGQQATGLSGPLGSGMVQHRSNNFGANLQHTASITAG
jgi:hypothetical protein